MNPNNALKTPAGYNGRTSSVAYDLGFEYSNRGIVRGFIVSPLADGTISISSAPNANSMAIASDGVEKTAVYMGVGNSFNMTLTELPTPSWRAIVLIVKPTPTGTIEMPDNPESVAVFEIPADSSPLTDEEVAEQVMTSPALGDFQGGKWVRICDVKAGGTAPITLRDGKSTSLAIPFNCVSAPNLTDNLETTNSLLDIQRVDLTTGTWLVLWNIRAFFRSSSNKFVYGRLNVNSAQYEQITQNGASDGSIVRLMITSYTTLNINGNATVETQISPLSGITINITPEGTHLTAIRIK